MPPKTTRIKTLPAPTITMEKLRGPFTVPVGFFGLAATVYLRDIDKSVTICAGDMESLESAWAEIALGIAMDESRVQRVMLAADVRG